MERGYRADSDTEPSLDPDQRRVGSRLFSSRWSFESHTPHPGHFLAAAAVLLGLTALLALVAADRLVSINDEGIYLEGAERIVRGQVPYRDFFLVTGPGTFWLQAGVIRLFGPSYTHARMILILDVAFLSAAVFWCTAHLAGRRIACLTTFLFVAFETADPGILTVNHRWDSCASGVAAVVLLFSCLERRAGIRPWVAGILAALAVWITPTLLALAFAIAFALVLARQTRLLPRYTMGLVAGLLLPAMALWRQGALRPMMQQMLWTGSNYPSANGFSYGGITGGYAAAVHGANVLETAIRSLIVFVIAIPAILPPLVFVLWPLLLWLGAGLQSPDRRQIVFLLVAGSGLWLSAYPWFVGQLTSTAPLCYILGGALLARIPARLTLRSPLLLAPLAIAVALGGALFLNTVRQRTGLVVQTRVGQIRVNQEDAELLRMIAAYVHPRDTLFVFPYRPIIYFLLGATNTTRYSFLQPGMMTDLDESNALADLVRTPPRWILYEDVPPEAYLRIWPRSDPKRLRMQRLELYIQRRYRLVRQFRSVSGSFQLREIADDPVLNAGT